MRPDLISLAVDSNRKAIVNEKQGNEVSFQTTMERVGLTKPLPPLIEKESEQAELAVSDE
jgi:hypothetical protein